MIRFECPQCGKKLKAGPEQAGARFKCTRCGTAGRVPRWSDEVKGPEAARVTSTAAAAWRAAVHDEAPPPILAGKRFRTDSESDMTPMVDVTFQLLIFFMITASFALAKTIPAPPPDASDAVAQQRSPKEMEDDFLVVRIDQDSILWLNDREVPTRHELIARLRQELSEPNAPRRMLVSFHPDSRFEQLVMCTDVAAVLKMDGVNWVEKIEDQ